MPGQIDIETARKRNRVLRDLAAEKNLAFRRRFVGTTLRAITLETQTQGATEALTDNYLKLQVQGEYEPNQWISIEITAVTEQGFSGIRAD
jgi:tRNA A37 methylthiotransferase MiaB